MSADAEPRFVLPSSVDDLPSTVKARLIRQDGLVTLDQLFRAGVSRSTIRWRLGRSWDSPLPGIVQVRGGPLDARQRRRAALLLAGPEGMLTSAAALQMYGLRTATDEVVDVIMPRRHSGRRVRWVHIHRTALEETRPRTLSGLRVVSVTRAILDQARWARDERAAEATVIEACQRRLTTTDALWRDLTALGPAPGTARARRALGLADSGAWSVAEGDLVRLLRTSPSLPSFSCNPSLAGPRGRVTTPDVWFDDVALAVMVHSRAHHLLGDDWEQTVAGDSDLVIAGAMVIAVAPTEIARRPTVVRERIEAAYATAATRPRPPGIRMRTSSAA